MSLASRECVVLVDRFAEPPCTRLSIFNTDGCFVVTEFNKETSGTGDEHVDQPVVNST